MNNPSSVLRSHRFLRLRPTIALLLLCLVPSAWAAGKTYYAANNGLDSATCGAAAAPCRSISQAMSNASTGDTILVGPGIYGDVNGNGNWDPGDEDVSAGPGGYGCVVCVLKPLRILSTHGAAVTFIEGRDSDPYVNYAVYILYTDNVTFGSPGKGFTVRNYQQIGMAIEHASNVDVGGNIAFGEGSPHVGGSVGFSVDVAEGEVRLTGNTSVGSRDGFAIYCCNPQPPNLPTGQPLPTGQVVLVDNTAMHNERAGFSFFTNSEYADRTAGRMVRNASSNNGIGVLIQSRDILIKNNTIAANEQGIVVQRGDALRIVGNSLVGNLHEAIVFAAGAGAGNRAWSNNIFGNASDGCAVANASAEMVNATRNYWGAASGPGTIEPADSVCNPTTIRSSPFSAVAFPIVTAN